jgi:hypothetical protein
MVPGEYFIDQIEADVFERHHPRNHGHLCVPEIRFDRAQGGWRGGRRL